MSNVSTELIINTAIYDQFHRLLHSPNINTFIVTLVEAEKLLDKEILVTPPKPTAQRMYRARFADMLLLDISQLNDENDIYKIQVTINFIKKHLSSFSNGYILSQLRENYFFNLPVSIGQYPADNLSSISPVCKIYADCVEQLQN